MVPNGCCRQKFHKILFKELFCPLSCIYCANISGSGYKLVALPRQTSGEDATRSESTSSSMPADEGETVAVLTFISVLKTFTHAFSLWLVGNAAKGVYGERCVLAVVLTALRLLMLRMKGRTSQTVVETGKRFMESQNNIKF